MALHKALLLWMFSWSTNACPPGNFVAQLDWGLIRVWKRFLRVLFVLYRRIAMIQAQAHFSIVKRRQECHDFAIVPSGAPRYTGDKEYASLHRQKLIVDALMILRIIICCLLSCFVSHLRQQHNNHHHQHKKNNTTEHSIIIVEKKKK